MEAHTRKLYAEQLLAAMLLHVRSVAKHILDEISDGALSAKSLIDDMGIPLLEAHVATLFRYSDGKQQSWTVGVFPFPVDSSKSSRVVAIRAFVPTPVTNLPPVVEAKFEQMRGATPESNWMVQGRVMLGEVPGGWNGNQAEDLTHILHCNVNVIC